MSGRGCWARLLGAAAASFLGLAALSSQAGAETVKLRASTIPIADNAAFEVAKAKGFFAAEGIEVDTTPTPGGAAGIPALVSGQLQVASSNIVSIILAASQGLDLVIIAAGDATSDAPPDLAGLVSKPGSGLKTGQSLEGKRIAVNSRNNIVWLYVREWVQKTGGDPTKVSFIEVPFPQMLDAVQQGRVDAAMLVEPFLSAGLKAGTIESVAWPYSTVQKRIPVSQFVTTKAWAKEHPDLVKKFTDGHDKAVDWTNQNLKSEEFLKVVSDFTKIPAERLSGVTMPVFVKTVDPKEVAFVAELMKRNGILKSDVDVRSLIHPSVMAKD